MDRSRQQLKQLRERQLTFQREQLTRRERRRKLVRRALVWAALSALAVIALITPALTWLFEPEPLKPDPEIVELTLEPDKPKPKKKTPDKKKQKAKLAIKRKPKPKRPKPTAKKAVPKPPALPRQRLKMVEVNNPESKTPPPDARFLSDKNRRVEKETRARHTNLVRDSQKPKPKQDPKQPKAKRAGAKKTRIAELDKQESPRRKVVTQPIPKTSPLMNMRPRAPKQPKTLREKLAELAATGTLAPEQRAQKKRKALDLSLNHRDYDAIYGKRASEERRIARLRPSQKSGGRIAKKWKLIQSALENFTPDVRVGNQTALGTRADPFALYIARMHRRIHKLWGFGFLSDLDLKSDSNPLNNMSLWTMLEIAIKPDGSVAKMTVVKPSGRLEFDAAALDVVNSAGPYLRTPKAIRSANSLVYMHWRFHRNHRQCGTFGVDPYILTTPPTGPIDGDFSEIGVNKAGGKTRRLRRLHRPATPLSVASAATRKAHRHRAKKTSRAARKILNKFLDAFKRGDASTMAGLAHIPFTIRGRKPVKNRSTLRAMFKQWITEAGARKPGKITLYSPMEALRHLGYIPKGISPGSPALVARVKLDGTPAIVAISRNKWGKWSVAALQR